VVEVRCVGGSGKELVGALKLCKCEVFEGYVDWTPKLMERECYIPCAVPILADV